MAKHKPPQGNRRSSNPLQTKEGLALQQRIREHITKQFAFSNELRVQNAIDFAKRAARVDKFQKKIFEKGLEAVGVSYEEIKARQEKDHALAQRHREKQWAQIVQQSQRMAIEHKRKTKRRQAMRHRFERETGNPTLSVFLCERADKHYFGQESRLGSPTISVSGPQYINGFGENVTRVKITVSTDGGEWGTISAFLIDEFAWMSDRDGLMNVEAIMHLNGAYDIGLVGKCIGHSAASLLVYPLLYVAQNVSGQEDVILGSGPQSHTFVDIDREAGCVQIVSDGMATPLDTGEISLTRSNFPLQANKVVLVSVVLVIVADAYNDGSALFDLKSESSFGMDVPCVALIVNP